jgi:hypothetical protein
MSTAMSGAAPEGVSDEQQLAAEGDYLERLLGDIQATVGPSAWPKIEALVRSLMELYGAALERLLDSARQTSAREHELNERVVSDSLLSSLLALHGLHPLTLEQRIELSLGRISNLQQSAQGRVELASLERNRATLRVVGVPDPVLAKGLAQLAAREIDCIAPELEQIELENSMPAPPQLISVERLVAGGRA